jgi:hypothetical protein
MSLHETVSHVPWKQTKTKNINRLNVHRTTFDCSHARLFYRRLKKRSEQRLHPVVTPVNYSLYLHVGYRRCVWNLRTKTERDAQKGNVCNFPNTLRSLDFLLWHKVTEAPPPIYPSKSSRVYIGEKMTSFPCHDCNKEQKHEHLKFERWNRREYFCP